MFSVYSINVAKFRANKTANIIVKNFTIYGMQGLTDRKTTLAIHLTNTITTRWKVL